MFIVVLRIQICVDPYHLGSVVDPDSVGSLDTDSGSGDPGGLNDPQK